MYRILHSQTVAGAILIDDIDDGLPNKDVHRLATGNPDALPRDGYSDKPKQPCYVPRTQASKGSPLIPGYIDLNQTPRVVLSAGKGKISKLQGGGLIKVLSIDPEDVKTPTLITAVLTGGDLTITGTTFESIEPDISTVVITGTGAVTLTATAITDGGGSVSADEIVIPDTLLPGVAASTSSVRVVANSKSTPAGPVLAADPPAPTLTTAVLAGGNLTLTGTGFVSVVPNVTSVAITGTGAIVLTEAEIVAGGGTVSATSIFLPAALVPGIAATTSSAAVTATAQTAGPVAVTV